MVDYNFSLQALEGVHQPMVTVTKVLRGLAAVLVERLFTGKPPANKRAPALVSLLTPLEARVLAELHIWKRRGSPAAPPPVSIPRDRESRLKVTLKDMVTRALTVGVQPRDWQATFHDRLVLAVGGGTQGSGMPYDLDPVVEKGAWNDLRFQRTLAAVVKGYLRERVLFIPGEYWMPHFSAGAFWALIGLAEIGDAPGQKAYLQMLGAVREEARRHVLREGWAGFWDQWLIRVAREQWPLAFEQEKDMFCRALSALPLVARRSAAFPEQKSRVSKPTIWERLKKWLPTFFGLFERKAMRDGKKAGKPMELAHPDWEDQVPGFFKEV